jgi:DNA-binding NarL/FixJ family response regulator
VTDSQAVASGRDAFHRGAWCDAYALLLVADRQMPLSPEDLNDLATAAYLIGEDAMFVQASTRAHNEFLERGDNRRAARVAFWVAFLMAERPKERAQAAGWLARAQRLVHEFPDSCVEEGWLLCAAGRDQSRSGDGKSGYASFARAAEIGERFGDRDLIAMARHGMGRSLLVQNRRTEGIALLDEAMLAVTAGEISPIVAGIVYCSVLDACHREFDLRRAQEWTSAFQSWCSTHPDVTAFRGHCLIRRSELMQLHGVWDEALAEAKRACDRVTDPSADLAAGSAYYQLAELYRLRGETDNAEEAYRQASQAGRKPHPGLALLRLAQDQADAAEAAIRLALQESRDPWQRLSLLSAAVEILLAKNDVAGARAAADELAAIAQRDDAAYLRAMSSHAGGAIVLAEGQPLAALESLRSAASAWREIDAPYELARTRMLIGTAYRELGDEEGAQLEFEAAQEVFERLGATPAAAEAAALAGKTPPRQSSNLTGREIEVLRLIATGVTNRTIAGRLGISEKTVARHVSNIFTKLDLPSRAAATAYAYDHKLV